MKTVTRVDLFDAAHYIAPPDLPRSDVEDLVQQTLAQIVDTLGSGQTVKISCFGAFNVHQAPQRMGRNPKRPTEEFTIPAQRRVVFRAANELKAIVDRRSRR